VLLIALLLFSDVWMEVLLLMREVHVISLSWVMTWLLLLHRQLM
jgi:hypothetical protein